MNKNPAIILANPQMGENIGAAARAMLNCGLENLRLVNPRDGWPNERADAMSAGALEKMPPVQVFGTVAESLADCHHVYATTARRRDMLKPVLTARQAATDIRARTKTGQRTAILFGGERAGLSNEDIALTHTIVTIPLNPDFSSLNLGQSVLLCAYEWAQAQETEPPAERPEPALHKDFEELCTRLEQELAEHNFFRNPEMQPVVARNLRATLARAEMTDQEVRTFHGVISALIGKKDL